MNKTNKDIIDECCKNFPLAPSRTNATEKLLVGPPVNKYEGEGLSVRTSWNNPNHQLINHPYKIL